MKRRIISARFAALRFTALLLVLTVMCTGLAACGSPAAQAATMKLAKILGTVGVSDSEGQDLEPAEELGLYSGYQVATGAGSYAWIDLDSVKRTKMDEESEIEISKDGKALEISVLSGSLFFNITEPLAADETLDIRTSSMIVGIRGTCGWVEVPNPEQMNVYLLEGRVEYANGNETALVAAGEMAKISADGKIEVSAFSAGAVPAFVRQEIEEMQGTQGIGESQETQENDELAAAIQNLFGTELSGPEHDVFWFRNHPGYTAIETYSADGEWRSRTEFIYDVDGLLLCRKRKDSVDTYLYDDEGKLTVIQSYQDGQLSAEWYVTEDTARRRIISISGTDTIFHYFYDEAGREVRTETYGGENKLKSYSEFEYDERGRPARKNSYSVLSDGSAQLNHYLIYEYD